MPTFLLMRAGQTAWESEGRLQGALDIPLSPEGIRTVEQKGEALRREKITLMLCGTDLPSVQTAEIVERISRAKVRPAPELREISLGVWEGLLEEEACKRNPRAYRFWKKNPLTVCPPLGEPLEECHVRVSTTLRRLAAEGPPSGLLLVCARFVAALVRCIARDAPIQALWNFLMPPAALETIQIK